MGKNKKETWKQISCSNINLSGHRNLLLSFLSTRRRFMTSQPTVWSEGRRTVKFWSVTSFIRLLIRLFEFLFWWFPLLEIVCTALVSLNLLGCFKIRAKTTFAHWINEQTSNAAGLLWKQTNLNISVLRSRVFIGWYFVDKVVLNFLCWRKFSIT